MLIGDVRHHGAGGDQRLHHPHAADEGGADQQGQQGGMPVLREPAQQAENGRGKGENRIPGGAKDHGGHLVKALIHPMRKGRAEDQAQGPGEHHPAEVLRRQGPKVVPHVEPKGALHPHHDVNDDHAGEQPAKGAVG